MIWRLKLFNGAAGDDNFNTDDASNVSLIDMFVLVGVLTADDKTALMDAGKFQVSPAANAKFGTLKTGHIIDARRLV